jgi:spore germination cell wall hydrolase CwlJ-like protein
MSYLPNLRVISIKKFLTTVLVLFLGLFLILNKEKLLVIPEILAEEEDVAEIEVVKPKYVDSKQLKCLAANIFYEAGSEPEKGKQAVARVVMNRVKHGFAANPCTVIYQVSTILVPIDNDPEVDDEGVKRVKLCQFSWVCESDRRPINPNDPRYKQSERIAYNVLAYDSYKDVIPNTVLFFHAIWVNPMWPYKKAVKIGNHIFYEKHKPRSKKHIQTAGVKDA